VGDRYLTEVLRKEGLNFGGEKSERLIFLDHATTADGALAASQTLAIMKITGCPLRDLATRMTLFPQILLNVSVAQPILAAKLPEVLKKEKES
jgi:phosphoglucosamine mutase